MQHREQGLTGAFALDALDGVERRRFVRHLARCPDCRHEVDGLREAIARSGLASDVPLPPARREAVLAAVHREASRRRRASAPRPRPLVVRSAAVAASITLLGLGTTVVGLQRELDEREGTVVALESLLVASDVRMVDLEATADARVRLVMAPSHEEAVLLADGLAPAPSAHHYELWLLHDDVAVPAGALTVDDRGHCSERVRGDMSTVTGVAVTIEPDGAGPDPTGPSGPRVAQVRLGG